MTRVRSTAAIRIGVGLAALSIVGGALAGCSRDQPVSLPPAATTTSSAQTTAAPAPAASAAATDGIQSELNAATSANSNANGDIGAGNSAAATNDNP